MLRTVCALVLIVALGPITLAQDHSDQLAITLQRTECYGECPSYKLTIRGDGSILYEGYKFVRVKGIQKSKIARSDVQDLLKSFIAIDYFGLRDAYMTIKYPDGTESVVTDLPTTLTSLTMGLDSKTVEDYVGAPEPLKILEHKIDEVVGSKRWVFIDATSVHSQCRLGWDLRGPEALMLLRHATESGDAEVVKAFIDEGADIDAAFKSIAPLQVARGAKVVRLLIGAGANVNAGAKTGLGPPLNRAADLGDADSISALIKAGAKVNNKTSDGITALMLASERGNLDAVKQLLVAGADTLMKDNSGHDALHYTRYGLERTISDENHPGPFSEHISDYKNKFRIIEELLVAARATPAKPIEK